jgi:hypothetical protein
MAYQYVVKYVLKIIVAYQLSCDACKKPFFFDAEIS